MRYRVFSRFPIPFGFYIPTCMSCGAEDLDKETAAKLANLMAGVYTDELRRRLAEALVKVYPSIRARQLEKRLGLSPGYLSRLCPNGKSRPSAPLVALLTLLAHEPQQRLRELAQDWEEMNRVRLFFDEARAPTLII